MKKHKDLTGKSFSKRRYSAPLSSLLDTHCRVQYLLSTCLYSSLSNSVINRTKSFFSFCVRCIRWSAILNSHSSSEIIACATNKNVIFPFSAFAFNLVPIARLSGIRLPFLIAWHANLCAEQQKTAMSETNLGDRGTTKRKLELVWWYHWGLQTLDPEGLYRFRQSVGCYFRSPLYSFATTNYRLEGLKN